MASFNGQLTQNELFSAIYNMIISQDVFGDNIKGTGSSLVDAARVDGSLYGDTKLYYATDVLKSVDWVQDSVTATNLLAINRPAAPSVQAIKLDVFRQIPLTLDAYMTKRAFADEGAFSAFNSIMQGWMNDTKRIYDASVYNAFIGATETSTGNQSISITLPTQVSHYFDGVDASNSDQDIEATSRLAAQTIGKAVADVMVDLTKDFSRDYNDYGYIRSYDPEDIKIVWNADFVNKIEKLDVPTIFNKDGLIDKFAKDVLPKRYFGITITSSNVSTYSDSTPAPGKPINSTTHAYTPGTNNANGCVRVLEEMDITVSGTDYHLLAGDELPAGAVIYTSATDNLYDKIYINDDTIVCKIIHKNSVPYMSAFEVATDFFNARNLSTNHYLTFGRNTLEYLKNYPFITIRAN